MTRNNPTPTSGKGVNPPAPIEVKVNPVPPAMPPQAAPAIDRRPGPPSVPVGRPAAPTKDQPRPPARPTHDEIAERAYAVYIRRGSRPGTPDQDWAAAERELLAERGLI